MSNDMKKFFEEMPEELRELLGISPTDFKEKRYTNEPKFDLDNPPLKCEDIPDSLIPVEVIKKAVEIRKLLLEMDDIFNKETSAYKVAVSSPYAQVQWLHFRDEMTDALRNVNSLIHTTASGEGGIKRAIDEVAEESHKSPKEIARDVIVNTTLEKILGN